MRRRRRGAVLTLHPPAFANEAAIVTDHDTQNTFGPAGAFRQGHPARIFLAGKGTPGGAIEGFNPANNDKLRIAGFGLAKPEAVKELMLEDGRDIVLNLPGGPSIRLLNTSNSRFPTAHSSSNSTGTASAKLSPRTSTASAGTPKAWRRTRIARAGGARITAGRR